MIAGAIDLHTYKNGVHIPYSVEERMMCDYGFVRYSGEYWHYEYGTPQWDNAEKKREAGVDCCVYPLK
jgi:hypothetical protein